MDASEMIYCTPADYAPILMVIGLIIGAVVTFAVGLGLYYDKVKEDARAGQPKAAYGLSYLTGNVMVVIIATVAALVVPGMYYSGAGAVGTEAGYYLIGAVAAVIVALLGDKGIRSFLEAARDRQKAKEASSAKTE